MGEHTDKVKGKIKESVGNATDNDRLRREGKADRASGKTKGAVNDAKGKVDDAVDAVKDKFHRS
jgi:uncharacterized protein YjbJ (UPF0337 family)